MYVYVWQEQHNNFPLRGSKATLWEGGVRGDGFIGGGLLDKNRRGKISEELIHITDWYPTICEMAGCIPTNRSVQDGFSALGIIQNNTKSLRDQILHNIDPESCNFTKFEICGAVRMNLNSGHFKLVIGNEVAGGHSEWAELQDVNYTNAVPTVDCKGLPPKVNHTECPYNGEACLYKLDDDPCEYYDVKGKYPNEYKTLMDRLYYYNSTMVTPLNLIYPDDPSGANPKQFGGFWSPWRNISEIELYYLYV